MIIVLLIMLVTCHCGRLGWQLTVLLCTVVAPETLVGELLLVDSQRFLHLLSVYLFNCALVRARDVVGVTLATLKYACTISHYLIIYS